MRRPARSIGEAATPRSGRLERLGQLGRLWRLGRPDRRGVRVATTVAMVAGAALIEWSASIHLDLWLAGYRSVPTIGTLFLVQAIAGFTLGAAVALSRRTLPALAGAALLLGTAGGFLWSVTWGLFGFKDLLSAPFGVEALVVELIGTAVLATACGLRRRSR